MHEPTVRPSVRPFSRTSARSTLLTNYLRTDKSLKVNFPIAIVVVVAISSLQLQQQRGSISTLYLDAIPERFIIAKSSEQRSSLHFTWQQREKIQQQKIKKKCK